MSRTNILCLMTASALFCGASVLAQDLPLEEIVVTAQKREQNLQEVGLAVTAFSAKALREMRMLESQDVIEQVPNVTVANGLLKLNPNFTIRGVASAASVFANQPSPVAVNVDEVFLTSHALAAFNLFDLERVEVLRGPQGTLLGRNTTAGAINFVSAKPTDALMARASLDVGRFNQTRGEAVISGPLSDIVRGRAAILLDRSDGHLYNRVSSDDTAGIDMGAFRAMLDWTPNDDVTVLLNVHGGYDKSEASQFAHFGGLSQPECADVPLGGQPDPSVCVDDYGYADDDGDPFAGDWDFADRDNDIRQYGVTATVDWDLGPGTLTSITAFDDYDRKHAAYDEDGSPVNSVNMTFVEEIEQFSQEIRFASDENDRLFWLIGAYYGMDELRMNRFVPDAFADFLDIEYHNRIDNDAFAVFAHTEYQFTDQWKLIAGLRYTRENKKFSLDNVLRLAGGGPILDPWCDPDTCSADESWSEPSGKIGIEYTPSDSLLFYGNYNRGFKSGGYPGGITTNPDTFIAYNPEFVDAWEIGFKSTLADGRLRLNGTVFYYDYTDRQEFTWIPSSEPGSADFFQVFSNAGQVEISGGEFELMWAAADSLDISLGVGLVDSEYKDFVLPEGLGAEQRVQSDLTGNELPLAPEVSLNGRIRHQLALAGGSQVVSSMDFRYQDDVWFSPQNANIEAGKAYSVWNARVAWLSSTDRMEAAVWIRNAFDEEYKMTGFVSAANGFLFTYGMPRTYGVSLAYRWGQ